MTYSKSTVMAACLALASVGAVSAQDAEPHLNVELNAAQQQDQGCKLSFLITNGHAEDITKAIFETVIFDAEGQVNRLTLFDFGTLPAGRPRVRQFVIPGAACDSIGQVLFNGANTCDGAGPDACTKGLTLGSRTDIEVTG